MWHELLHLIVSTWYCRRLIRTEIQSNKSSLKSIHRFLFALFSDANKRRERNMFQFFNTYQCMTATKTKMEHFSSRVLLSFQNYPLNIFTLSFHDNSTQKTKKEKKKQHFNFVSNWETDKHRNAFTNTIQISNRIPSTSSKLWKRLKLCDKYFSLKM